VRVAMFASSLPSSLKAWHAVEMIQLAGHAYFDNAESILNRLA